MPDTTAWAVPGVPLPRSAPGLADDVVALQAAVDAALTVDVSLLAGPEALERTRLLLLLVERLQAAALDAVADVDARELWAHAAAGSTRTWLRTLPCGDRGQLGDARSLADAPLLRDAVRAGTLALRPATALARGLARLPEHVPDDQLHAALVDGTTDVLRTWCGVADLEPSEAQRTTYAARRVAVRRAVEAGLHAACWGTAAQALEPVALLLGQSLPPADADAALGLLVDALQPEPDLQAEADQEYRSRDLVLKKLKGGGWSLRGHLTDEAGQLLHLELRARERQARGTSGGTGDDETGPGADPDSRPPAPALPPLGTGARAPGQRPPVEGEPQATPGQRTHDALATLLHDLSAVEPGSGRPAPAALTITATLEAVDGRPGAPPPLLRTPRGAVPLTEQALARHSCDSMLAAVLLDALGQPVGASGEHRHATARERRAMVAAWGQDCAVNGCGGPGTVPHHVVPFALSGRTAQQDLVPVCEHHHHDVHDGGRTLRLRDGRLIDGSGWVDAAWSRAT